MATQLKNIVRFVNVPAAGQPGNPATLPHGLTWSPPGGGDLPQIPDHVTPSTSGFTIGPVTATNVTVTNNTSEARSVDVLCELWHTFERAFGDVAIEELAPRPFIEDSGEGGNTSGVLGFGIGLLNVAATQGTGDNLIPWYESGAPAAAPFPMAVPRAGTLRNLVVRHNTPLPAGAGNNVTYTVFVNNVATALVVVVAGGADEGFLGGVGVPVAQRDNVDMRATHGALAGEVTVEVNVVATMEFED